MEQTVHVIGSVEVGQKVTLHCFVEKELRKSKKNEEYWSLNLSDVTGELFANIWKESQLFQLFEELSEGQYMQVTGVIGEYKGALNIQIQLVKEMEEPTSFVVNDAEIKRDIGTRIRNMKDPGLKQLLLKVFEKKSFSDEYFKAPLSNVSTAAGSWRGGASAFASKLCSLIDHATDGLAGWNYQLDSFNTKLNKEFLIALAILEPIGRVRAYKVTGHRVRKTEEGEMFSEQYLTNEILLRYIHDVDLPEEKKQLLKHAIASVPGKEYAGALVYDRIREAVAFNMLWNLNMQMMHFEQLDRMQQGRQGLVKLNRKTVSLQQFSVYEELSEEEMEEMAESTRQPEEVVESVSTSEEVIVESVSASEEVIVDVAEDKEPTNSMMEALSGGQ